jgi:hypothetical protein
LAGGFLFLVDKGSDVAGKHLIDLRVALEVGR